MTTLSIYQVANPHRAILQTSNIASILKLLSDAGIPFEQWPIRALPQDADAATVLSAYQPEIARLKAAHGYTTADVVRVNPGHPERVALRQKFIEEHTHADDEVRFFIEGSGAFYVHLADQVVQLLCQAGDLISVPAGTKHWFDMGPTPHFTAIRLFVSPEGWVGHFTGDPLPGFIPKLDSAHA
jgi:1,2-dihydroxy-3-keto-5-methylthiopentene dioxygenase